MLIYKRIMATGLSALALAAVSLTTSSGWAADRERDADLVRYLWAGVKDHRERLQTGVFHATGRKQEGTVPGPGFEGDITIFCTFDFANGKVRFDRSEGIRPSPGQRGSMRSRLGGKTIITPETTIFHLDTGKEVFFRKPEDAKTPTYMCAFDVRTLGWICLDDFWVGTRFPKAFDMKTHNLSEWSVIDEENGLFQIWRLFGPGKQVREALWIDENQGFTVRRYEWRLRSKEGQGEWLEPVVVSEVTATLISEIWVPKTFRLEDNQANIHRSYELSFAWNRVNSAVDEKQFTVDGLGLKKGTYLIDQKLGLNRPVVTGAIGRASVPEFAMSNSQSLQQAELYDQKQPKLRYWLLSAGAAVVVLVVLIAIVWRRARTA